MKPVLIKIFILLFLISIRSDANNYNLTDKTVNIYVLFGMPGAGKGTVSQALIERGYIHFSIGDFLRDQAKKETVIGLKYKGIILSGHQLIPSSIAEDIIKQRVLNAVTHGQRLIIDGFPRTIEQAQFFDELIKELDLTHSVYFVYIAVDPKVATERVMTRQSCDQCKHVYILKYYTPKKSGICDICGGIMSQRKSDNLTDITKRIQLFESTIKEILEFYKNKNLLTTINGNESLDYLIEDFLRFDDSVISSSFGN